MSIRSHASPLRISTLLLGLLAAGCGDDGGASTSSSTSDGGDSSTTAGAPDSSGTDDPTTGATDPTTGAPELTTGEPDPTTGAPDPTTGGDSSSTGEPASGPQIVHEFDVAQFQLPEGLDVADELAYVGLVTGPVFSVDPDDGTTELIGGIMGLPADNTAIMTGVFAGKQDDLLYLALDVFAPGEFVSGIYTMPRAGGPGELFASDPAMVFPNGMVHDADGDLLVADSFTATIFHVALADGAVTPWVSDPLLAPNPDTCKIASQFHLGANGIVVDGDRVLVTNTDQASIVEIPIAAGGAAGKPGLYMGPDCDALHGVDGLVIEPGSGDLLVPVNYKQRIIRIDAAKQITVLAEGGLLQSPATLVMAPAPDSVLIANAAFEAATSDPASAHPALLSLALD